MQGFVFDLYCNEISNNKIFYAFGFIERLRTNLLSSENKISIHDLGAGTNGQLKTTRKIKDIANKSLSNQKTGELLFKLVNKFQPKNVIEIGTSLGISTLYLSLANSKTNVYTLEGSEAILKIAKQLSGLYKLSYAFIIIPLFIRDTIYDFIAKNRYKWFGKKESCMIPTPDLKIKFLASKYFKRTLNARKFIVFKEKFLYI